VVTDKKAGHLGPLEAPGPTARLGRLLSGSPPGTPPSMSTSTGAVRPCASSSACCRCGYRSRTSPAGRRPATAPAPIAEDGDLIYFAPWGNVGFYYNAEGIDHDDKIIHVGRYRATAEHLSGLRSGGVTVEIVE